MKKPELLAPAGDMEKLEMAIEYGADAVYLGGEMFSLRAGAGNFSLEGLKKAEEFVHERGKKIYLTLNIYPHNADIKPLEDFVMEIRDRGISMDGYIISDPGVLEIIKATIPEAHVHLSTQANTTNYRSAGFWAKRGVSRIILARELSLKEIRKLVDGVGDSCEFEAFVHGAMCISYSGRCLLSNFLTGRDANRGMCAHPCRWRYALVEEERPGQYYPVEEDGYGTYIINSKDLCMIEHIPQLVKAGIGSFKIEGRIKSPFYVATVVGAYRKAIDSYFEDPEGYVFDEGWLEEVKKVSHREFTTGFFIEGREEETQDYSSSDYIREYSFTGKVLGYEGDTGLAKIEQRNKMVLGDELEIFGPGVDFFSQKLETMWDEEGNEISSAPHPQQIIYVKTKKPVKKNYLIRKRKVKCNDRF